MLINADGCTAQSSVRRCSEGPEKGKGQQNNLTNQPRVPGLLYIRVVLVTVNAAAAFYFFFNSEHH